MDNVKKFYDKYPDGININKHIIIYNKASNGNKSIGDVNKVILTKTEDLLDRSSMGYTQMG